MVHVFQEYLEDHFMDYETVGNVVKIGKKVYIYLSADRVLDEFMQLILNSSEDELAEQYADHAPEYVFEFGGRYYSRPCDKWGENILTPFLYRGEVFEEIVMDYVNLGVHGKYELMSGTRDYNDWCAKAKFFDHHSLGICEKNTLAGTLSFQLACNKAGITPIIGGTFRVEGLHVDFNLKMYASNQTGWRNLLNFNKIALIDNSKYIKYVDIKEVNGEGIIAVLPPTKYLDSDLIDKLKCSFDNVYFQLDMSEFEYDEKEKESLFSMKKWYTDHREEIQPIMISDSYYLEKEDSEVKRLLNKSGVKGEFASSNQHYKHVEELWYEWTELWKKEDKSDMVAIFKQSVKNTSKLAAKCHFEIDTKQLHLPKYFMTEEEAAEHKDNESMIDNLLKDGVERLIDKDKYSSEVVWERIDYEMSVIRKGGFVNYFLITRDIINWANANGIITGIGRGSAAGCLVSYLLGIVLMNPLDYDLLFERFLNESRLKGSMPDIDIDFPGEERDRVKRYMEERFGGNHVASVGTYQTLQLQAAFQEMSRQMHTIPNAGTRNYLSSMLKEYSKWHELFTAASDRPQIKTLIQENGEFINNIQLALGTPKSQGVHACATIVCPRHDHEGNETTIFDYVPMRKDANGMLITAWEGGEMESAGFLKEDILGIVQLDKFAMMFKLIKEFDGTDMLPTWNTQDISDIDENAFKAFWDGHTADIFQFNGDGMTKFLRKMKPDSIEDLIAANALYRPGPMGSNAHNDYCDLKNGEKEIEYDWGCENITNTTYGLIVYQEQVMKICEVVGGFTLVEADNVRKAMGKKKKDLLDSFGKQFVEGAMEKGCPADEAQLIWEKMEIFSAYAFNKSHAAAYAKTAYWCQWLKVNYPIQFWTAALTYGKDDKIPPYISEILDLGHISIMPPDVNSSEEQFTKNMETGEIFWSLSKIKGLGETSVAKIIDDRKENGMYFELSEFIERTGSNKRVVEALILSGSFDDMYNVKSPTERGKILKEYFVSIRKEKTGVPEQFTTDNSKHEWFWFLQQKKVSGMANLSSFQKVMRTDITPNTYSKATALVDGPEFHDENTVGKNVLVGGFIVDIEEKKTKKGDLYCRIRLDCNYTEIKVTIWGDTYMQNGVQEQLKGSKGKLMFMNGKVAGKDRYNDCNTIASVGSKFRGGSGGAITKIDVVG